MKHSVTIMRTSWIAVLLVFGLYAISVSAQNIVAEGEYEGRVASATEDSSARTVTRWTLYRKSLKSYTLKSEIVGPPDVKGKLFQIEELDENLVPLAIGYEWYEKGQEKPSATSNCKFAQGSIDCWMHTPEGDATCKRHQEEQPFWFWIEDMFTLDLPWSFGGVVNMAHLEKGKTPMFVLTLGGGSKDTPCDLTSEQEGSIEFVGIESIDFPGAKVTVKRYRFLDGPTQKNSEPIDVRIAGPGIVVKMSGTEGLEFILTNYKQYEKLIPELPVEIRPGRSVRENQNK